LIFRILAKFRNRGTKKKNAAATSGRTFFLEPQTKWFDPLHFMRTFASSEGTCGFSGGPDPPSSGSTNVCLCGPSQAPKIRAVLLVDLLKLRNYVLFFWWRSQAPKLRAVLLVDRTRHKVGLYASRLIWTFSRFPCEEGASERASEAGTQ
jgi:hypothetical protein